MNDRRSQNAALAAAILLVGLRAATVSAEVVPYDEPPRAVASETATFGADSPIGAIEYHAGRGLRLGDTRVTIGGFATAEAEALESGDSKGGLEGLNFFLLFDPLPFVHGFAELETGGIAEAQSGRSGIHSSLALAVERAYGDFGASDALNVRFGKFLTPIGRWNPVPAEPLTWTTSTPLIVDDAFDESLTGAMLWGSLFPGNGSFSYSLYGSFLDPLRPPRNEAPADHVAGAYLAWESLGGFGAGASVHASQAPSGRWRHLGGIDGVWAPSPRLELSGEAVFGEGSQETGALWGLYAQAVVETIPTLYAVGRYERFEPPEDERSVDLFVTGLAWVPLPYVRLKADYSFADHESEVAEPGFRCSLSLLF